MCLLQILYLVAADAVGLFNNLLGKLRFRRQFLRRHLSAVFFRQLLCRIRNLVDFFGNVLILFAFFRILGDIVLHGVHHHFTQHAFRLGRLFQCAEHLDAHGNRYIAFSD